MTGQSHPSRCDSHRNWFDLLLAATGFADMVIQLLGMNFTGKLVILVGMERSGFIKHVYKENYK